MHIIWSLVGPSDLASCRQVAVLKAMKAAVPFESGEAGCCGYV